MAKQNTRTEHDLLGEREVPNDVYWGIHTLRAIENFPVSHSPIHPELVKALIVVKKAAAITNDKLGLIPHAIALAIIDSCDDLLENNFPPRDGWDSQFPVDALQGGAGTSANMNVNEVVANRAIERLGGEKGNYKMVHPLDHVNFSQSTNDVFPTAVRVASIGLLKQLAEAFAELQTVLQQKENEYSHILKIARTQLQDAVPMLLGQSFGAWAAAIARDRWRLYKSEERLRQVNLGGTAIGTGLNADKQYVFQVTDCLRELTGLGLSRSEFMMDSTQNCDVFVEVSGLVKTAAVNLMKIANDLRLLSSGPKAGLGELNLPQMQAGSSIMPGKVNPVIPEMVNQVAFQVIGNDAVITQAAAAGQMELNAFLPVIAKNLFEMITLMTNVVYLFINRCIRGITPNPEHCTELVETSNALSVALSARIGYELASEVSLDAKRQNKTVRTILLEYVSKGKLTDIDGTIITEVILSEALNLYAMTMPGIPGKKKTK